MKGVFTVLYYGLFSISVSFENLIFIIRLPCFLLIPPADCQLREQVGHGHGSAAAVPGYPGVHGAQQSGSLPQGGTRDHHWSTHSSSSGVSRPVNCICERNLVEFFKCCISPTSVTGGLKSTRVRPS